MNFNLIRSAIKSVMLTMALLCGSSTVSGQTVAKNREAMIVVLSFFNPVGRESRASYNYESYKNSQGTRNYPLPLFRLPKTPPKSDSPEYTRLQYLAAEKHLSLMKKADFDVALFDMLPIPDYDPNKPLVGDNEPFYYFRSFLLWLRAGESTHMTVGIFADFANRSRRYPQGRYIKGDEWVKILSSVLRLTPDSPALWKINGRMGIIHFGTDDVYTPKNAPISSEIQPDGGWGQVLEKVRKEQSKPFFFVADVRPHKKILAWNNIADAAYIFAPAAPASFMTNYQRDISKKFRIPYYWFVSPGYYNRGVEYTFPNFRRIHDTYMAAMNSDARKMVVISWNDMNEDHDIWPSINKGYALLDVFGYYNEWFKSCKQPKIKDEKLLICYPLRAPVKITTSTPVWGGGKWVAPPFSPKISYWALLKTPRTLKVAELGEVKIPAGLSMGDIGSFKVKPGAKAIPVAVELENKTMSLPAIKVVPSEKKNGGLQERYLDLLSSPVFDPVTTKSKSKWDLSKAPKLTVNLTRTAGIVGMTFLGVPQLNCWAYLRGSIPLNAISGDVRFVKLVYRGTIPSAMKMLCVLQQPGNVYYIYNKLPLPKLEQWTTVLIPVNHFNPASWGKKVSLKIPDMNKIRYINIGVKGRPQQERKGNLEIKECSFLK